MKCSHLIAVAFVPFLLTGCAATRPIGDLAMGAGGAALANEFSHGNPVITAAGAAGGVLVSEGLHYASRRQAEKAYTTGYEKGRSDAVKQQYWILVNQQKEKAEQIQESVRYYEIPVPEQTIDGTILNPTTKLLRIEE
jgi:ADP-ribosylglycohydrolase